MQKPQKEPGKRRDNKKPGKRRDKNIQKDQKGKEKKNMANTEASEFQRTSGQVPGETGRPFFRKLLVERFGSLFLGSFF